MRNKRIVSSASIIAIKLLSIYCKNKHSAHSLDENINKGDNYGKYKQTNKATETQEC